MYTRGGKSLPSPSHDLRSFPSAYARLDTSLFPEPMLEATEDILSICTFADNYSFVVDPSVCANPSEETTAPLVPSTASPVENAFQSMCRILLGPAAASKHSPEPLPASVAACAVPAASSKMPLEQNNGRPALHPASNEDKAAQKSFSGPSKPIIPQVKGQGSHAPKPVILSVSDQGWARPSQTLSAAERKRRRRKAKDQWRLINKPVGAVAVRRAPKHKAVSAVAGNATAGQPKDKIEFVRATATQAAPPVETQQQHNLLAEEALELCKSKEHLWRTVRKVGGKLIRKLSAATDPSDGKKHKQNRSPPPKDCVVQGINGGLSNSNY
eukprot:GHVT01101554.1.p1 GENE.GHVT01101554.1~~GHVT01101554.1.p1  ORF type:complete len:327 (-),score=66.70 GHVT01101554.1:1243-2223(-)